MNVSDEIAMLNIAITALASPPMHAATTLIIESTTIIAMI